VDAAGFGAAPGFWYFNRERSGSPQMSLEAAEIPPPSPLKRRNAADLAAIGLTVFAAALRVRYFVLFGRQPLWWDEAEYLLKAKSIAFGTPSTGFWAAHSIGLPVFAACLFKLGLGETTLRLIWVGLSTANVMLLYLVGSALFGAPVGLIAAALLAIFPQDLFVTNRLLVDMPQVFFVMVAAWLFVKAEFEGRDRRLVWLVLPVLLIGTVVRFSVGFYALTLLAYLLITRRARIIRETDWLISGVLGFVVFLPFLIYSWIAYGGLLSWMSARGDYVAAQTDKLEPFLRYATDVPAEVSPIILVAAAAGLILIAAPGRSRIARPAAARKFLLVALWILIPWGCLGRFAAVFDPRLALISFTALFLVIALGIEELGRRVLSLDPALAAALAGILAMAGCSMLLRGESLIREKAKSYESVREAGEWIKQNSQPGDVVISTSVPQITFYSERATYNYPGDEKDFMAEVQQRHARYMVLSRWEPSPDWVYQWQHDNPDQVRFVKGLGQLSGVSVPTAVFEFTAAGAAALPALSPP
jgi:dolichyl-phosphate-mannose-protein mannosyltransferase